MARNNRGGNNRSTAGRRSGSESTNSSSRSGSNRSSSSNSRSISRSGGVVDLARERPVAAAAVAAGAAAAGLFLWTRRTQITDQISNLSDQIGEWTESFGSGESDQFGDDTGGLTSSARGMSETGGGNASLGAVSGGGGSTGTASGRGRARSTPTTQQ